MDPLQESAHRDLMRLYDRLGRRAEALGQYQRCVDVLRRELGVTPEAETRRLHATLTATIEALAGAARRISGARPRCCPCPWAASRRSTWPPMRRRMPAWRETTAPA